MVHACRKLHWLWYVVRLNQCSDGPAIYKVLMDSIAAGNKCTGSPDSHVFVVFVVIVLFVHNVRVVLFVHHVLVVHEIHNVQGSGNKWRASFFSSFSRSDIPALTKTYDFHNLIPATGYLYLEIVLQRSFLENWFVFLSFGKDYVKQRFREWSSS